MDQAWLEHIAASPWLYPALFALVVGDAFLVVLPSETFIVTLGALWAATGAPSPAIVIPIAAAGALTGDLACFLLGREVGLDRWAWQRRGRIGRAIDRARLGIHRRAAVLVFTARYVPFARIAVNLAAGSSGLALRRYLPLSAGAGLAWAVYNTAVGATVGAALSATPLLAIIVSVVVAVLVGLLVDAVSARLAAGKAARAASAAVVPADTAGPASPSGEA
ncbi:DedA family protein [Rathayibacter sp. YIM 133350]|uniref:DedA family protein n=1 Tax=Rathayibacter sp. YIM 133350 TaxID=3131992 RepID=UPI00307E0316